MLNHLHTKPRNLAGYPQLRRFYLIYDTELYLAPLQNIMKLHLLLPSGIRKIDPSAYTIGSSNKPSSGSMAENGPKNSRIVIDDSWLKFNNENDIPKPRPFINKTKLYPSGRGSSVPLNLASF